MKRPLAWKSAYTVGSTLIDNQHRHFFDLINQLDEMAVRRRIRKADAMRLLRSLSDYAFYHFATEEEYLEQYLHPRRIAHAKLHDVFRLKIAGFIEEMEYPGVRVQRLFPRVASFARSWLTHHILKEDRRCASVFRKEKELPLTPAHETPPRRTR